MQPQLGAQFCRLFQAPQLFLFANEFHERSKALGTILSNALGKGPPDPPLIGGCYIAGTGQDSSRQQAFSAGVLRRLVEEQDCVQWTPEARAEEERLSRVTTIGWGVLGGAVLVAAALLFYFLLPR